MTIKKLNITNIYLKLIYKFLLFLLLLILNIAAIGQDFNFERIDGIISEIYDFNSKSKLNIKINLAYIEQQTSEKLTNLSITLKDKHQYEDAKLNIYFDKNTHINPSHKLPFNDTIDVENHSLRYKKYLLECNDCVRDSTTYYRFTSNNDSLIVFLLDFPLRRGKEYLVDALLKTSTDSSFILKNYAFTANSRLKEIEIRTTIIPSLWDKIRAKLFGTEAVLIGIILALITLLWKTLLKRLASFIEKIFDFLGKTSSGYFARRRFLKKYLDYVIFQHKYLNLVGFNTAGISKPLLEDVFISLRVSNFDKIKRKQLNPQNNHTTIPFSNTLKKFKKLVILGMPGAGKTTTLSYALLAFAKKEGKEKFDIENDLLPLFIPLRQLSSGQIPIEEDLTNPKSSLLPKNIKDECPANFFQNKLEQGKCLVLLDGLDEVTDQKTHREVNKKIDNLISDYPDNYFVVTCRIAGWQGLLNSEFTILETQNFSREEIQEFVWGWHTAIVNKSELDKIKLEVPDENRFDETWREHEQNYVKPAIKKMSGELLNAIYSNTRILSLAQNPMLLSLIALVHFNRATLPKGRAKLYKQCLELLIDSWDRKRDILSPIQVTATDKENILRNIAFDFQTKGKGEETRENIIALIENLVGSNTLRWCYSTGH